MFIVYLVRVIFIVLGFFGVSGPSGIDACSPLNLEQLAKSGMSSIGGGAARILGNPTHTVSNPIGLAAPITDTKDLFCYDFTDQCRWKNLDGFMVDELDWLIGRGDLGAEPLKVATGTSIAPDGAYLIVASDKVQLPTAKAVLVSDVIACQSGQAELRFRYWTSPGVNIIVCTKKLSKIYPDYDHCSKPIEHGEPGPTFIAIPELSREAFQIFIIAQNFAFSSHSIQGGFAIIDDIEYYGDLCFDKEMTPGSLLGMPTPPLFLLRDGSPSENNTLFPNSPTVTRNSPCIVLTCSFESGDCLDYIQASDWKVTNRPVGNPLTGIRGDASHLPYNKTGSYAYVEGPKAVSRLTTRSFQLDEKAFLFFAFYKVSPHATFRVYSKMTTKPHEELVFDAPKMTAESKRWFKEARLLDAGLYDYLVFEVRDLPANAYVGVDEFVLLNDKRLPYC